MVLTHYIVESGALAFGWCISAKHYNRCRRIHILLASAMRLKHIKLFLSQKVSQMLSQMPAFEELCEKIQQINDNPSTKAIGDLENSEQIQEFLKCYEEFSNETRKGKHGMTVKYWYVYAEEIVANYLHMSRAVRTNDIDFSYLSWGK